MADPRVFISYSWDSDAHRAWTLMLADRLVDNGVDVQFDQYGITAGRNITQKMELNISKVDKVIIVFTENYVKKAEEREGGVGFEYSMISAEMYRNQTNNTKFIPVLRSGTSETSIPNFMRNYLYVDMREGKEFEKALEDVLRAIYNEPRIPQPPRGKRPDFKQRDRSYTPSVDNSWDTNTNPIGDDLDRSNQIHEVKKRLKRFIMLDDLEGALLGLSDFAEEDSNNRLSNDVILLFARFNSLKKETTTGLLAPDQATRRKIQIQHAIVSTIDGLR